MVPLAILEKHKLRLGLCQTHGFWQFHPLIAPEERDCPGWERARGSAGRAQRQLQQDHLPVLGRVAFVDVSGESRRAVEEGGAVLAGAHLCRVQQAHVALLAAPVGKGLPADRAQVAGGRAQVERRGARLAPRRVLVVVFAPGGSMLRGHVLPQVGLALEPLAAVVTLVQALLRAGLGGPGAGCVPVARLLGVVRRRAAGRGRFVALRLRRRGRALRLGFVPAPVRGEVGWAAEHLVALGAPVLDPDYPGALVLRQRKGVCVRLPAQLAHELAPRGAVPAGRRRPGRLQVERGLFYLESEDGRRGDIVLKLQFPDRFGFLGRWFPLALGVAGGPLDAGGGAGRGGRAAAAAAGADFKVHRGEEVLQRGECRWCGERLRRERRSEPEASVQAAAVVVLAGGPGGAVERLADRLGVPELHRPRFVRGSGSCGPAGGCRCQRAHRDECARRSRAQARPRRVGRLFRVLLLCADTVRNRVGFLVPFDQKPPRHVGGRAEGGLEALWRLLLPPRRGHNSTFTQTSDASSRRLALPAADPLR